MKFKEALENDLNTANAISVLYDVLKDNKLSGKTKIELIKSFDKVLSLDLTKENSVDEELAYAKADEIRNKLLEKKIVLKDTREGTTWELINE